MRRADLPGPARRGGLVSKRTRGPNASDGGRTYEVMEEVFRLRAALHARGRTGHAIVEQLHEVPGRCRDLADIHTQPREVTEEGGDAIQRMTCTFDEHTASKDPDRGRCTDTHNIPSSSSFQMLPLSSPASNSSDPPPNAMSDMTSYLPARRISLRPTVESKMQQRKELTRRNQTSARYRPSAPPCALLTPLRAGGRDSR